MEFHNDITMGLLYGILTTDDEKIAATVCWMCCWLIVSVLSTAAFYCERQFCITSLTNENTDIW